MIKKLLLTALLTSFASVSFAQNIISQTTTPQKFNHLTNQYEGDYTVIKYDNDSSRFITRFIMKDGRVWKHIQHSKTLNSETNKTPIITIEYNNYE